MSSSVMVRILLEGPVILWTLAAVADTLTLLADASTVLLSTAVMVTVPLLVVAPAAMVRVVFMLRLKSELLVERRATAETSTVVASLEAWFRVAVTVLTPPSSLIEVLDSASVTVGVSSSSVISTSASVTDRRPGAEPVMATVSSGSSVLSSVGIKRNVPVPDAWFAPIMMVNSVTSVKSVPETAVPEPTVTVTAVSLPRVPPFSRAVTVTVVAPAPSSTSSGDTDRVTPVEAVSSSFTVTVTLAAVTLT